MIRSRALAPWLVAALVLSIGCATRHGTKATPSTSGETIGVYKGQVWGESKRHPRFKLLLYARPPDHIHAELYPPVGGSAWVLDSGDARLSLTIVDERVAYVGAADAETLGRLFGIAIAPSALVSALLDGTSPGEGFTVQRESPQSTGLPKTFEIRQGARGFRLELNDTRPVVTRGLATGTPPAGVRQAPLDELAFEPAND